MIVPVRMFLLGGQNEIKHGNRNNRCIDYRATGVAKAEPQAEVLHWWTSGGEAKSVAVLQEEFSSRGGTWKDMPVAGGGGDAAMTALRARVLAGNAPAAVQLKGPAIQEWYEEGVLADISAVAKKHGWADVLRHQLPVTW